MAWRMSSETAAPTSGMIQVCAPADTKVAEDWLFYMARWRQRYNNTFLWSLYNLPVYKYPVTRIKLQWWLMELQTSSPCSMTTISIPLWKASHKNLTRDISQLKPCQVIEEFSAALWSEMIAVKQREGSASKDSSKGRYALGNNRSLSIDLGWTLLAYASCKPFPKFFSMEGSYQVPFYMLLVVAKISWWQLTNSVCPDAGICVG